MIPKEELDRQFTYHAPTEDQKHWYSEINKAARNLAGIINMYCPDGADKSAAIRKVREAKMTANAAIACQPQTNS